MEVFQIPIPSGTDLGDYSKEENQKFFLQSIKMNEIELIKWRLND